MLNQVTLLGNLGQTPDVKTSSAGKVYSRFLLATNEAWMKDGQKKERTDWHRVVAFGKLAEALKVLTKGDKVAIQGILRGELRDHEGGRAVLRCRPALTDQALQPWVKWWAEEGSGSVVREPWSAADRAWRVEGRAPRPRRHTKRRSW